jgi:hypothetical protein
VRDDFEIEKEGNPGWACPAVRIFDETMTAVRFVEAGSTIPGWVEE